MDFCNELTSAPSNERILQLVTSDFIKSNGQRVNFNELRSTCEKVRLKFCTVKYTIVKYCTEKKKYDIRRRYY